MSAGEATAARMAVVAGWDVPLLRGAVATLEAMSGRLRAWRARLEGVGRSLASGEAWTGPAARSATAMADEVSSAAWAVDDALTESLTAFQRLVREVDTAQEFAARAVTLAAATVDILEAVTPGPTVTATALAHAAAVGAAADDAGTALSGIGVRNGFAPADLSELAPDGDVPTPRVPTGRPPDEVAAWWASLSVTAQLAAIRRSPAAVGRLDGVPSWARDRANRRLLARALQNPEAPAAATVRAVAEQIRAEEGSGRQVRLQLLDLERDRVVLALGDPDTADAVALLVPGVGTTPADDLARMSAHARDVASSARAAAPGISVATVVWLGYRTPGSLRTTISRASAWRGGLSLASDLAGLAAARTATGNAPSRTTVLAHSYGTVVVDEAADAQGDLAADAVVLLGSPGMEENARSLEAPEVYDAASSADPISGAAWFGRPTWANSYGSTGLPVEAGTGHSDYYDRGSPTLAAIGEVVAGHREPA
jgi:hypothetical protein